MITTVIPQSQNISKVDALWVLIQSQTKAVRKALTERLLAERSQTKAKAQQQMVKDSLTRAFDELHSGKAQRDARKLFAK
jgi:hypothetical protein